MVIHTSSSSTHGAEAEGSRIQGQPAQDCLKKKIIALMGWICHYLCELYFNSIITITSNNFYLILNNRLDVSIADALQSN